MPTYLPTHLPTYLPTYVRTYVRTCNLIYIYTHRYEMIDIASVGQGLKAPRFSQFSEAEILSFRHFRPRPVPFEIVVC